MGDDASVALAAQHRPAVHGHHEQAPVRQPAQAARPIVDLEFDPGLPVGADRHHVLEHEVGEPQPVVVPAWSLSETEPIQDEFQASVMRRGDHGGTLARPPRTPSAGKPVMEQLTTVRWSPSVRVASWST